MIPVGLMRILSNAYMYSYDDEQSDSPLSILTLVCARQLALWSAHDSLSLVRALVRHAATARTARPLWAVRDVQCVNAAACSLVRSSGAPRALSSFTRGTF